MRLLASFFNPARTGLLALALVAAGGLAAQNTRPRRAKAATPEPVTLEPGRPLRIKISTEGAGGGSVIIRLELERGGAGPETPPGPDAADGLAKELAALYQKDTDADKAKHARALGELYAWAAKALRAQAGTAGGFRKALGARSEQLLPTDVLVPLRQRVQTELRAVLPGKADTALGEDTRAKAADLFERLSTIMNDISR